MPRRGLRPEGVAHRVGCHAGIREERWPPRPLGPAARDVRNDQCDNVASETRGQSLTPCCENRLQVADWGSDSVATR